MLSLAVVTAVMNSYVLNTLKQVIPPADLQAILFTVKSIASLGEPLKTVVKEVFIKGFNLQFHILLGLAMAQCPVALVMWWKKQIRLD